MVFLADPLKRVNAFLKREATRVDSRRFKYALNLTRRPREKLPKCRFTG